MRTKIPSILSGVLFMITGSALAEPVTTEDTQQGCLSLLKSEYRKSGYMAPVNNRRYFINLRGDGRDRSDVAHLLSLVLGVRIEPVSNGDSPRTIEWLSNKCGFGSIGYREDLSGSREGAQCLAAMLGKGYFINQKCDGSGFPYNVLLPRNAAVSIGETAVMKAATEADRTAEQERLAKEAAVEKRRLAEKAAADEQERAQERKDALARERMAKKFRGTLEIGQETHCGMIIDKKGPIVRIQTIAGEKWLRTEQVYPPGMHDCRFYNGQYVD